MFVDSHLLPVKREGVLVLASIYTDQAGWFGAAADSPLSPSHLTVAVLRLQLSATCTWLYVGSVDQSSSCHACRADILAIESPPLPFLFCS